MGLPSLPLHAANRTATSLSSALPQETISLGAGWQFRLDPGGRTDPRQLDAESSGWQSIEVPHTWQIENGIEDYTGVAWYRTKIFAPAEWKGKFVRVEFEAVSHTARVFLNDLPVGEHIGKAYTAFTCDLQSALRFDEVNTLLVRVDNAYSDVMLPRMKSYDWTNDGGIIRPVQLLITPQTFIERIEIDSSPDLDRKQAMMTVRAVIRNTLAHEVQVPVAESVTPRSRLGRHLFTPKNARIIANGTAVVELPPLQIDSPFLWHFDSPHLYEANVVLRASDQQHIYSDRFGIRKFESAAINLF